MIEQTNVRVENHILQAKKKFKSEMIDLAISLAMQRLPVKLPRQTINDFWNGTSNMPH